MIRTNNRVALYARFSSDNQRSESIDAQIRAMTTYCKQHNFLIVDSNTAPEIIDENVKGIDVSKEVTVIWDNIEYNLIPVK